MSKKISYKGTLPIGLEDKISLRTINGKTGYKITNAKSTFSTVNKVASAVNKGKKVTTKGVKGVIKRAVSKIL